MIANQIYYRWKSEYIDDVDLNEIEYLNLTAEELNKFLHDNYLDETICGYVSDQRLTTKPIGLIYLDYHFKTCERKELLGASSHVVDILEKRSV